MSNDFQVIDTRDESVLAVGDNLEEVYEQLGLQIGEAEDEESRGWF